MPGSQTTNILGLTNSAFGIDTAATVIDVGLLGNAVYQLPKSYTKAKSLATQQYPRLIHEQVDGQQQLMTQLRDEGAASEQLERLSKLHEHLRALDRVAPRAEGETSVKRHLFHASAASVSRAFLAAATDIAGETPSAAVAFGLVHVDTGAAALSVANLDRLNSVGKVVKSPFGIASKTVKAADSTTGLAKAVSEAVGNTAALNGASEALAVFGTASPIGTLVAGGFNLAYNTMRTIQRVKRAAELDTQAEAVPTLRRHLSDESFAQLKESVKYRQNLNAVVASTQAVKLAATATSIVTAAVSLSVVTAPVTGPIAFASGVVAGAAGKVSDVAKTHEKNLDGDKPSLSTLNKPRTNGVGHIAANGLTATMATVAADFKQQRLAVIRHKLNSLILHVLDSEDADAARSGQRRLEKVTALIDPERSTPGGKGLLTGTTMRPSDVQQMNAMLHREYGAELLDGSLDEVRGRLLDGLEQGAAIADLQETMAKKVNKDWISRLGDHKGEPAIRAFLASLGFLKRKPISNEAIAALRAESPQADAAYRSALMTVVTSQLKTDAKYQRVQHSNLLLELARTEMSRDVISTLL